MKKFIKCSTSILGVIMTVIFSFQIYFSNELPDSYKIVKGENLELSQMLSVKSTSDNANEVSLNLLGVIPIKNVTLTEIEDYEVCVSGEIFGIKIFTQGVMVVGISDVETDNGNQNPATNAGIKIGDNILSIDGKQVSSNEDVSQLISESEGKTLTVIISRKGKQNQMKLTPILSKDGAYKAGMWVRDSSAGIGTMTFYNPVTATYAGLGHAICDVDTGDILPLGDGEIVGAKIQSISKSTDGKSGSICGIFDGGRLGDLKLNTELGIYGTLDSVSENVNLMKVALKQEIEVGKAQVLCSIDNNSPQYYDCEIIKIKHNNDLTQNMVIEITDKELLEKAGGIVQGMSGSPIIQNGKLVGAVTHVFVNDTSKGYAIFAENMYEQSKKCG